MAKQRDKLTDKEVKNARYLRTVEKTVRRTGLAVVGACQLEPSTGDWNSAILAVASFSPWGHTLM